MKSYLEFHIESKQLLVQLRKEKEELENKKIRDFFSVGKFRLDMSAFMTDQQVLHLASVLTSRLNASKMLTSRPETMEQCNKDMSDFKEALVHWDKIAVLNKDINDIERYVYESEDMLTLDEKRSLHKAKKGDKIQELMNKFIDNM